MNFTGVHLALHSLLVSYSLKNAEAFTTNEENPTSMNESQIESINQAHVSARATNSTPGSALINFLAYNTLLVLFASSVISGTSTPMTGGVNVTPDINTSGVDNAANDVANAAEDVNTATLFNYGGHEFMMGEGESGDGFNYGGFGEWLKDNAQVDAKSSVKWAEDVQ